MNSTPAVALPPSLRKVTPALCTPPISLVKWAPDGRPPEVTAVVQDPRMVTL